MTRHLVPAVFLSLLVAVPVTAQQRAPTFQRWESALSADGRLGSSSTSLHGADAPRRDYRYEGLAIGGGLLGALGAVLGHGLSNACPTEPGVDCTPDRLGNAVVVGLAGAAVGGGLGFLIGWLSPKDPSPGDRDPSDQGAPR